MMNIIRDPMWGRNNEGYSECPHLTGEMAHAVVSGMQGDDERYLQIVAGCKHFVPYGPFSLESRFHAQILVLGRF